MHSALFIDELLREIFLHCSESDRPALTSAARTCKAWTDPAVDALWERLPSFGPLLLLLPGISVSGEEYIHTGDSLPLDLRVFEHYARRVKYISNRQCLRVHTSVAAILPNLWSNGPSIPNLTNTHISIPRCNPAIVPLNISPNLIRLDLDLGFKKQPSDTGTIMNQFLDQVVHECPKLRHVGVRGLATHHMNQCISIMRNLQFLSLRLGNSLLQGTLQAVMGFPHLIELEVHAGHISLQDTLEKHHFHPYGSFIALQKLHISAQSSTIKELLDFLQPHTLLHLHIELVDTYPSSALWSPIFERICSKGGNSLLHLTLEHYFEILEPPTSQASNVTLQGQHSPIVPNSSMSCQVFQVLTNLKHLRHFACNLTLPPTIFDENFENFIESWPDLEHLEIGPIPYGLEEDYNSQLTPGILAFAATMSSKLERLFLPLIISEELPAIFPLKETYASNRLRNITIAQLNTSRPSQLGDFLQRLFPSLDTIEGPSDDVYPWIEINTLLQKHSRNIVQC